MSGAPGWQKKTTVAMGDHGSGTCAVNSNLRQANQRCQ